MGKILFLHPDLGIGGAERLVVDAAVALKQKGHSVHILTAHHDEKHCFEETRDGTIPVTAYGDWLPKTIFGYFYALCAFIRMIYISVCLILSKEYDPDVIFIDQVSIPIPILKWKTPHIIFYCHFPDQLLSQPGGALKTWYRKPLNWLEEYTTCQAPKIFVNSKFTSEVFLKTFKSATKTPGVLHPSLATDKFDTCEILPLNQIVKLTENAVIFLSLNRYERKKNIRLAIDAFQELKSLVDPVEWEKSHLVIAGGYDENLLENVEHFQELEHIVESLELVGKVTMLKSPTDQAKISLLRAARCLLYTPSNEHFGIVPLEAMYLQTPVIAVDSGGPRETIVDSCGFLKPPRADAFAHAMYDLLCHEPKATKLGENGRDRVIRHFSFDAFSRNLDLAVKGFIGNVEGSKR